MAAPGARRTWLERYLARRQGQPDGDGPRASTDKFDLDVFPQTGGVGSRLEKSVARPFRVSTTNAAVAPATDADEFYGLREYRHGDNSKHIHWRTTARLGRPAIRQHERRRNHRLCLVADVATSERRANRSESGEQILSLITAILLGLERRRRRLIGDRRVRRLEVVAAGQFGRGVGGQIAMPFVR